MGTQIWNMIDADLMIDCPAWLYSITLTLWESIWLMHLANRLIQQLIYIRIKPYDAVNLTNKLMNVILINRCGFNDSFILEVVSLNKRLEAELELNT